MKKVVMFLSLCLLPTAVVMVCGFSVAASLVLIATLFIVAIVIINQSFAKDAYSVIRARKMHASIGAVIALSETVIETPPVIAIIIATGLFVIGFSQILRDDSLFGLDFHRKWNDELLGIIPNTLILLSALFSGLMIVAHFSEQLIWIPLIALGFLIIASVRMNVFNLWKFNETAIQVAALIVAALIGIISTVIQFHEARVFGILIWVITLVIGIILILTLVFLYFRSIIREKKRKRLEKAADKERQIAEQQKKEMLEQSLRERILELTWEEIWIGFNQIYESFGTQLLLSSPNLNKLSDLVTVSNEKRQIFWSNDLTRMFQIMESAARMVQDDENLKKVISACTLIDEAVKAEKADKGFASYKGEIELNSQLERILKKIKS